MSKVGIIGGGLGGLASACTLAARGHKVTLFEKNAWLGGKAAVLEEQGFRFDMGPTILTMPRVLERIFAEAGRNLSDYLDLRRLDPQWRCFYDDGTVLDLRDDPAKAREAIGALSPRDAKGFDDFMAVARRLADVSDRFFFWRSVEDLKDTMNLKANMSLATLSDVLSLRMHRTVAGQIKKNVADPRVRQMLEHFI
jgi:phytoene dehydrogenase-like protein